MSNHPENDPWRMSVTESLRELKQSFANLTELMTTTRLTTATTVKLEETRRELADERDVRREVIQAMRDDLTTSIQVMRDDLTTAKATIATLKWVAGLLGSVTAAGWAVFLVLLKYWNVI